MALTSLDHIASRICRRPLLILPTKLDIIARVLAERIGLDLEKPELGLDIPQRPEPLASRFVGSRVDEDAATGRKTRMPYVRTDAGVAIITTTGSLVNRGAWIGANSGLTSYEGIVAQFKAAANDPKVKSIIHDLDSPGGEATGAFEAADVIRAVSAVKPVTAFVNGLAASAGYALASGAKTILSVPSGVTGSIGVVMMHADYSRALANAGITPTFIHAGAHKVDGNPYEPLSQDVKADLQAEVDQLYALFTEKVAAGRGRRMSAKAARDTEARTFFGQQAKEIGLVDDLATFDEVFDDMNRSAAKSRSAARSKATMDYTIDDVNRARSEGHAAGKLEGHAQGAAEGKAEGLKTGANGERERIKSIVTSDAAKGREAAALTTALETSMTAEESTKLLATLPAANAGPSLAERAAGAGGFHVAGADVPHKKTVINSADIYSRFNSPNGG
jgi:signal peptide peptidase SppA